MVAIVLYGSICICCAVFIKAKYKFILTTGMRFGKFVLNVYKKFLGGEKKLGKHVDQRQDKSIKVEKASDSIFNTGDNNNFNKR
jgi:hypothetical protein